MTELARTPSSLPQYARDADRPYDGDPWLRQAKETPSQFAAFQLYLNLDAEKRTIKEATRLYYESIDKPMPKTPTLLSRWSKAHRWEERALAYDNFLMAKQVAANKREAIKASARHAKAAQEIQEVLLLPMQKLRERIKANGDEFDFIDGMSDEDLYKFARSVQGDVIPWQKAERDALNATSDAVVPRAELKVKGELVRRMLKDGTVRELAERIVIESTEPVNPSDD